MGRLTEQQKSDIEIVSHVLPFKVNNFVIENLINWDDVPDDPIFSLTFPKREMLLPHHYEEMSQLVRQGADRQRIRHAVNRIRLELNPNPGGQMEHNVPELDGKPIPGMQHKYEQTVLFFPSRGQTCHAYCTFCFRWPQFAGMHELRFTSNRVEALIAYLQRHPKVNDVLITGGDPLIMSAGNLATVIEPLINADLPNLRRIRIGTKSLTYWPYRFLSDDDSSQLIELLRRVVRSGLHLTVMAHFSHPNELASPVVKRAIGRVRQTGATIRTQAPIVSHINDSPAVWQRMWNQQVNLGCVPYYMFVARDTGAHHYFSVPLARAWKIFREAYRNVSGLGRTVRGPSMSANPGKVHIVGVTEVKGEKVFVLRFLQGRSAEWVDRPFFAEYSEWATWFSELRPAFGRDKFFFQDEFEREYARSAGMPTLMDLAKE
jgi:KamA family protein